MKKGVAFIVGASLLATSTCAYAFECNMQYDFNKFGVRLVGTAQAPVTVTVSEFGNDELETGSAVALAEYDFRGVATFDETILLSPDLPSGKYVVRARSNESLYSVTEGADRLHAVLTDNKQVAETSFYHINEDDGIGLLADINSAKSSSALYDVIVNGKTDASSGATAYTELLSVLPDDFVRYGSYVCKQMTETKQGKAYADLNELKSLLSEYITLYDIIQNTDASVAAKQIESNALLFGEETVEKFVVNLTSAEKTKLLEVMKNYSPSGKAFSEALPSLTALAVIQAADRWQTIEKLVTDTHKDVLGIDFDNVSNLDRVFQKMMSYSYKSVDDIKLGFNNADKAVNSQSDSGSSGGGGGGFGGGGSFEIAPSAPEQRGEAAVIQPTSDNSFKDMADNFWGKSAIDSLASKGIISGYPDGTFRPDESVTRAEFIKMLCVAYNIDNVKSIPFDDVSESDWHYKYIASAYTSGIINGVSDNVFAPSDTISREDACTVIYRYLISNGLINSESKSVFSDSAEFAPYASDAIRVLAANGIVNGLGDGTFGAKSGITRAACATLIDNCLKHIQ